MSTAELPAPSTAVLPDYLSMPLWDFYRDVFVPRHPGLRESSHQQFEVSIGKLNEHMGNVRLADLSDDLVTRFMTKYLDSGVQPSTVNNKRIDILAIWRFAHKKGYVPTGPFDVPKLKEPRKVPRSWSLEQFEKIVQTAGLLRGRVGPWKLSDWFQCLLIVCYNTAPRISSVMSLATKDINLDDRICYLHERKNQREECYKLSPQCIRALKKIWDPKRKEVFGDWPFDRNQRSWKALNSLFHWCIRFAEVPQIGLFHCIRRTAVTLVFDRDPNAALKLLGDTDVAMLRNHYVDTSKLHTTDPGDLLPRIRMNGKVRGWRSGPSKSQNGKDSK